MGDNAKKYVEQDLVEIECELTKQQQQKYSKKFTPEQVGTVQMVPHGKKTEVHKAAVVGDTVGDPLKDTSGPALNIVMKLMAILSLVFSDFFCGINNGQGLFNMPTDLDLSCPATGCQCVSLVNNVTTFTPMPSSGLC